MADPCDPQAKRSYVRRAKQTRYHTCHWPGCRVQVPPAMWGCKTHWSRLPKWLRDKVWAAYSPGQEERMDPSDEYLDVAEEVQRWIQETSDWTRSDREKLEELLRRLPTHQRTDPGDPESMV